MRGEPRSPIRVIEFCEDVRAQKVVPVFTVERSVRPKRKRPERVSRVTDEDRVMIKVCVAELEAPSEHSLRRCSCGQEKPSVVVECVRRPRIVSASVRLGQSPILRA